MSFASTKDDAPKDDRLPLLYASDSDSEDDEPQQRRDDSNCTQLHQDNMHTFKHTFKHTHTRTHAHTHANAHRYRELLELLDDAPTGAAAWPRMHLYGCVPVRVCVCVCVCVV